VRKHLLYITLLLDYTMTILLCLYVPIPTYLSIIRTIFIYIFRHRPIRHNRDITVSVDVSGWNMLEGAQRSCVGMNGRPGVCMGQHECTEANGKSVGRCFPFDSCCSGNDDINCNKIVTLII